MATSQSRLDSVLESRLEFPRFEDGESPLLAGLCSHFTNADGTRYPHNGSALAPLRGRPHGGRIEIQKVAF